MPKARRDPDEAEPTTGVIDDPAQDVDAVAEAPIADEALTTAEALTAAETQAVAEAAATTAAWPADDSFTAGGPPIMEPGTVGPSITEPEPGTVRMIQASAAHIRATNIEAHQSAAARVTGGSINMSQGASGFVRGSEVHLEQGAVGAIAAEQVTFQDGFALLVLARRVSGEVTVLLDWRGVIAAVAVLLVLGRLLRGRR